MEINDIINAIERMWSINAGSTSLISAMCDQIGLVETINELLEWDPLRCKLSPGEHVKALLINIIDDRKALYAVDEYFAKKDVECLFGPGVEASDFNDDALSRTLDKLHRGNPRIVFSQIAMNAFSLDKVQCEFTHFDTTSKSVYGAYEYEANEHKINVERGHSKDYRPDLKQICLGLLVNHEGIPRAGELFSGNDDDKTINQTFITNIEKYLGEDTLKQIIYVSDSALVTTQNLNELQSKGIKFISRVPGTFKIVEKLKTQAWQLDTWTEIGQVSPGKKVASYKAQTFYDKLDGHKYRFIVVHSSNLDRRKEKKIYNLIDQEAKAIAKTAKELSSKEFACETDAKREIKRFLKKHNNNFHQLDSKVTKEVIYERRKTRGRPRKDDTPPPSHIAYRANIMILGVNEELLSHRLKLDSTFVLITSLNDTQKYPEDKILKEYKEQTTVENSFRFLKSPYTLGPIFLNKPERIEALGYILLLALLVVSLLQRRVRQNLEKEGMPLRIPGHRETLRPTVNMLLSALDTINVQFVQVKGKALRIWSANNELLYDIPRLLRLLGFDRSIYLKPQLKHTRGI
jgi:transposase